MITENLQKVDATLITTEVHYNIFSLPLFLPLCFVYEINFPTATEFSYQLDVYCIVR